MFKFICAFALASGLMFSSAQLSTSAGEAIKSRGYTPIPGQSWNWNGHRWKQVQPGFSGFFCGHSRRGCQFGDGDGHRRHDRRHYWKRKWHGLLVPREWANHGALRADNGFRFAGLTPTTPAAIPAYDPALNSFGRNIHGKHRKYAGGSYYYFSP